MPHNDVENITWLMGQRYHNQRTHYRNILTNMIHVQCIYYFRWERNFSRVEKSRTGNCPGWKKTGGKLSRVENDGREIVQGGKWREGNCPYGERREENCPGGEKMGGGELSRVSKMTGGEVSVRGDCPEFSCIVKQQQCTHIMGYYT